MRKRKLTQYQKQASKRAKRAFEANFKKHHGNKPYVIIKGYVNSTTRVVMYCKEHDHTWSAVPANVSRGSGCPKCAVEAKAKKRAMKHATFVAKAQKKHGFKYTYPDQYKGYQQHIHVECPKHGKWLTTPANHLSSSSTNGCPVCANEAQSQRCRKPHEDFVIDARAMHGDKYEYPEEYKGAHEPITMICPDHGAFKCSPTNHTNKINPHGCPKCRNKSHEQFLEDARAMHGDRYSYPEQYKGCEEVMDILCHEHGTFPQTPSSHLRGRGCPLCTQKSSDYDAVYIWEVIGLKYHGKQVYKIGQTSARLGDDRIKAVAREINRDYKILRLFHTDTGKALAIEKQLLTYGEPVEMPLVAKVGGSSEFRALTEVDLIMLLELADTLADTYANAA